MKKILCYICLFISISAFAQDIPVESFAKYRDLADSLFMNEKTIQSIELYKRLANSGDEVSGYELYEIYSQGMGVEADKNEAQKWLDLAKSIDGKNASTRSNIDNSNNLTLQDALNVSGELMEKGAIRKNTAIALGVTGGLVGGIMLVVGASNTYNSLTIAGGAICGGLGIVAIVLDAVGNSYIKDGSKILKNIQFEGNGIKVSF